MRLNRPNSTCNWNVKVRITNHQNNTCIVAYCIAIPGEHIKFYYSLKVEVALSEAVAVGKGWKNSQIEKWRHWEITQLKAYDNTGY